MGKFLSDIRLRIRTPIGLILAVAGLAQWIFDRIEEGKAMLGHLPPIFNFLSKSFSGPILLAVGIGLIFWEIHDIGRDKGEIHKRRLRHYLRDAFISSVGVIVILGVLIGSIGWRFPELLKMTPSVTQQVPISVDPAFAGAYQQFESRAFPLTT